MILDSSISMVTRQRAGRQGLWGPSSLILNG